MLKINKTLISLLISLLSISTVLAQESDSSGTYFGLGAGWSGTRGSVTDVHYYTDDLDDSTAIKTDGYNENDIGYKIYGGYQINNIVGVEASYNNYGKMGYKTNEQKPESISVYANVGYNFLNAQLRPFGLLGLGYLRTNEVHTNQYGLDDDFTTLHAGLGVEYYPTPLKGFGVRFALESDLNMKKDTTEYVDNENHYSSETFYRRFLICYLGVQYKF